MHLRKTHSRSAALIAFPGPHPAGKQAWWEDVCLLVGNLPDVLYNPPLDETRLEIAMTLVELENTRSSLVEMAYPPTAEQARRYLLLALDDLLRGLYRMQAGDQSTGIAYIRSAQLEYSFLQAELAAEGVIR